MTLHEINHNTLPSSHIETQPNNNVTPVCLSVCMRVSLCARACVLRGGGGLCGGCMHLCVRAYMCVCVCVQDIRKPPPLQTCTIHDQSTVLLSLIHVL